MEDDYEKTLLLFIFTLVACQGTNVDEFEDVILIHENAEEIEADYPINFLTIQEMTNYEDSFVVYGRVTEQTNGTEMVVYNTMEIEMLKSNEFYEVSELNFVSRLEGCDFIEGEYYIVQLSYATQTNDYYPTMGDQACFHLNDGKFFTRNILND